MSCMASSPPLNQDNQTSLRYQVLGGDQSPGAVWTPDISEYLVEWSRRKELKCQSGYLGRLGKLPMGDRHLLGKLTRAQEISFMYLNLRSFLP